MKSGLRIFGAMLPVIFTALQAASQAGAALQFDGTNDYVVSANNIGISGNQPRTVEYWGKLVNSYAHHVNWGQTFNNDRVFGTYTVSGQLLFYAWGSSDFATGFVPDDNFHRVAVTYDGAFVRVYVDGVLTPAGAVPRTINTVDGKVYVGCREDISVFSTNTIDEVRIWNRVLCYNEIQNDLNCELPPNQNGLKLYYKFNHGTAGANNAGITTVLDASGNNNHGTLVNFALAGTTSNWVSPGAVTSGVTCAAFTTPEINITANSNIVYDGISTVSANTNTDFGNVYANSAPSKNFTVQNTGNKNLTVSSITFTGANAANFSISGISFPTVVSPGSSTTFSVAFTPSVNGARNAVIHINNDDCDEGDYDFPFKAVTGEVFTNSIAGNSLCLGGAVPVSYATNYAYNAGNVFTAQLSNATGSFANPVNIGSLAATASGTINATIPNGTAAGTAYRIRVVSSNPAYTGIDNGVNITISAPANNGSKDFTGSGSWSNPSNWSPCGVPNTNDNVTIGAADMVLVPAGYSAFAKSIVINAGGQLSVSATGILSVNGATGTGANGNGISIDGAATKLDNSGTIHIGNTSAVNLRGIFITGNGSFSNQSDASVTINNITTFNGIQVDAGIVTNNGTIRIGNTVGITDNGIYMGAGNFTNNGLIEFNRTTNSGLFLGAATSVFTNSGRLAIGNIANIGGVGIVNFGSFTNTVSGNIEIDRVVNVDGIQSLNPASNFVNSGTLKIGSNTTVTRIGIYNTGPFTNTTTGIITIDRITSLYGVYATASFTNSGTLTIGSLGTIQVAGIVTVTGGTITNNGTMNIDNIPNTNDGAGAVFIDGGSMSNSGTLTIGKSTVVKNAFAGGAPFTNTGTINMGDKIALNGITSGTTVTNNNGGIIKTNMNGLLKIAGTLINNSGASVINDASGTLAVNGTLTNSGSVTNNGKLTGAGTIAQNGTFTNTATARIAPGNSPGTLTVNGNFNAGTSTLDIEVNGKNAGQYDVLAVNGVVTIADATLNVIKDAAYTPAAGDVITFITSSGNVTGSMGGTPPPGFSVVNNYPAQGNISLFNGVILPIKLQSFTAQKVHETSNKLEWKTATETNGIQYQVERSADGSAFTSIGQQAGHGVPAVYTFHDNQPLKQMNYYRLKITEPTGEIMYSRVIALAMYGRDFVTVSPVPATDLITVINSTASLNGKPVTIRDMSGKIVHRFSLEASNRIYVGNWAAGVYHLLLPNGKSLQIVKQ